MLLSVSVAFCGDDPLSESDLSEVFFLINGCVQRRQTISNSSLRASSVRCNRDCSTAQVSHKFLFRLLALQHGAGMR